MRKSVIIFLMFLWVVPCQSQQVHDSLSVVLDENGVLTERNLENLNEKYQGEEFNYDIKTGESQNLIDRFLTWLGRGLNEVFGINITPGTLKLLQYLIYALLGGLTLYLIIRLLINEKFNSLFTKKANSILDISIAEQHIETLDLDKLLQNALEKSDYRLAIRYQYLRILKRLSQSNIIEWHFEKTNADYQREIKEQRLKLGFKKVSYLYDYIWYGEQPIDAVGYDTANKSFTTLDNKIPQ